MIQKWWRWKAFAYYIAPLASDFCLQCHPQHKYPVLLLVVRDFCFWAIWAAGPVLKKCWPDYRQLSRAFFHVFRGKKILDCFLNIVASTLKSYIAYLKVKICFQKIGKYFILGWNRLILKFSNLSEKHKALLIQDWVFRLGYHPSLRFM